MNCTEAKKIDIIMTLKKLGYCPIKETDREAWFLSPFRHEAKPSLKVSKQKNVFYDFGIGLGGNLIDLLSKLLGSVKEALNYLSENNTSFSFHQQPIITPKTTSAINVIEEKTIQHHALIDYLFDRKISISIARSICKEVHFTLNDKKYFSIGLKNISKGWELRNKYFKSGSSPKDISLIQSGHNTLVVTEGMFDMLTLLSMDNSIRKKADFLILNSCSFSEKLNEYAVKYDTINLYLDHDETGRAITEKFLTKELNYHDRSSFYQGYNDLNEWWVEQK
ncbi:toprim domain-containing protein [uncultured Zobellia sp.]|uniref:toprim domain-containing protein n=1 Tax=uncultured Zobellia sp. TaxID=255433 RepID=UPI002593B1DA|nr:toprim domain-containing protein [uncultured Zobellia sp.]